MSNLALRIMLVLYQAFTYKAFQVKNLGFKWFFGSHFILGGLNYYVLT